MTQLKRIRWAVRAALAVGVAASVTANVLHAEPNTVGRAIAAWPPLALLLTIELISRVPVHRPALAGTRMAATAAIAGIAAWVSYWHMVSVCARYGETNVSSRLIPLSVDGLLVVASVCLVELAGRMRQADAATPVTPTPQQTTSTTDTSADTDAVSRRTPDRTPKRTGKPNTATAVARLRQRHPDMPTTDIARRLGVTDRTVRRHLAGMPDPIAAAAPAAA